jgi:KamA family protein
MEIVARIFPFRTNNYIVDELIDWNSYREDPMFVLSFPQRDMLQDDHFRVIHSLVKAEAGNNQIQKAVNEIRFELNPHPAGQLEYNVPELNGVKLTGIQHKYNETILFFPSQGQTCHAYCTFCFRWPQFIGMSDLKFAMKQVDLLVDYLKVHEEVTDVLFTGGDPMTMNFNHLSHYIRALIDAGIPHLKNIRIGTKTLAFWPYRYLTDSDSDQILDLFREVNDSGINLAFMAHFTHPVELSTTAVQEAIGKINKTGAKIRTQSPVLNNINADPQIWADMWKKQVSLGLIPYYMFVPRDTGARHFFGLPLERTWEIFRDAYRQVTGICRTVRGPSMSANPGKVQVLGVSRINEEWVFVLTFLQARNSDWVGRPFFARYNPKASWLTDLKPAFGEEEFFYSREFRKILKIDEDSLSIFSEELNSIFNRSDK